MSGKHYNHATRVHHIVGQAVERLIYKSFASTYLNFEPPNLQHLSEHPTWDGVIESGMSDDVVQFLEMYNSYRSDIHSGRLGTTAQVWLMYADCVRILLRFHGAIKVNDFDEYVASMRQLCSLMFSADHINYARYLTLQYHQLMTPHERHPHAVDLMRANGFSVARSNTPGASCAIDLTIEQTINRSAKTPGGVVGFSRNPDTYYRWCITRHALHRSNMSVDYDDSHRATTPLEMKNSERYVQRVVHAFEQYVDPFSVASECQTSLICISSGQSATDDVCRDMAQYASLGNAAADTFITTIIIQQQVVIFQSPMKKMNLKTFQSMAVSKVVTTAHHKKSHPSESGTESVW